MVPGMPCFKSISRNVVFWMGGLLCGVPSCGQMKAMVLLEYSRGYSSMVARCTIPKTIPKTTAVTAVARATITVPRTVATMAIVVTKKAILQQTVKRRM